MPKFFHCTIDGNQTYLNLGFVARVVPCFDFEASVDDEEGKWTYRDTETPAMRIVLVGDPPDDQDSIRQSWNMITNPREMDQLKGIIYSPSSGTIMTNSPFVEISSDGVSINLDRVVSVTLVATKAIVRLTDDSTVIQLVKPASLPLLNRLKAESQMWQN
jgi:hypothetical protein